MILDLFIYIIQFYINQNTFLPGFIIRKENAVSVTYNPDCEFVIATVNAQSGVTNVTTGSISDVKKQSEVYLYGEFADTNHFNATKVVIAHWE